MALSHSGEAGIDQAPLPGSPRVRALDFSQPTKFTGEIRRQVVSGLEEFAEGLSNELSHQLKCEVRITLGEVSQDTWAAARSRLAADVLSVGVRATEPDRGMLLTAELRWVLQALECLLGGRAEDAPADRRLTEIDWSLTKGLFDTVIARLGSSWEALDGPALMRGELDRQGDAGISAPASEATLSVTLHSSIAGNPASLALLIPWAAAEPPAESLRRRREQAARPLAGAAEALRGGLSVAEVLLRAEVGSAQMPIDAMLSIEAGTLVELAEAAADGVLLFAEEVSVARGKPGRSGTHKALKLEPSEGPPVRAATYAKLGRAELERARAHVESRAEQGPPQILQSIFVRVWAELGRTHMSIGETLELAPGAVVELDQAAEDPVELFANGVCFANGALVVTPNGNWGVQVQSLV